MKLGRLFFGFALFLIALTGAHADPLSKPTAKPILTISGSIANTNDGKVAVFDRAMIEALGMQTVETSTPWYPGHSHFEGVSLDKLMQLVGASGTKVRVLALNDYETTIPLDDFKKFNVILALKRDGNYMPVRDKGPLFVIYPYDSDSQLQSETYYSRSAWQVAKMIIE
ncbi:molybdopterin-dependent oxidoreductase [Methylovirgula sp. 4M-Z18]|uniref:molybdopterin-dependent oxidoreductase n=1 Tax=Methylovirgula sp. 4M-Z18 TaxID=2293567 RepID=UPI000E2FBC6D|nr:molybdopterin-dependent oxidoreductase [Methylovirgula sp. 4M-Z18]RFB81125.1 oxidoreductase [Methylovirgula sp. 4M-Z18]